MPKPPMYGETEEALQNELRDLREDIRRLRGRCAWWESVAVVREKELGEQREEIARLRSGLEPPLIHPDIASAPEEIPVIEEWEVYEKDSDGLSRARNAQGQCSSCGKFTWHKEVEVIKGRIESSCFCHNCHAPDSRDPKANKIPPGGVAEGRRFYG